MFYYMTCIDYGMLNPTIISLAAAESWEPWTHYNDVIMAAMVSQITSLWVTYSTVCSGADPRKRQSSASLAMVMGIHRWPVNSPPIGPVTRNMFPFYDVIISRMWHGHQDYYHVDLFLRQFTPCYKRLHTRSVHLRCSKELQCLADRVDFWIFR